MEVTMRVQLAQDSGQRPSRLVRSSRRLLASVNDALVPSRPAARATCSLEGCPGGHEGDTISFRDEAKKQPGV